jgi:septal ring factor EnvC (AmiA/AmiB activator)
VQITSPRFPTYETRGITQAVKSKPPRRSTTPRRKPITGGRPEEAHKRLESERARLHAAERRSEDLMAELAKLAAERERLNGRLAETAKLVQQSDDQLQLIDARLRELRGLVCQQQTAAPARQ